MGIHLKRKYTLKINIIVLRAHGAESKPPVDLSGTPCSLPNQSHALGMTGWGCNPAEAAWGCTGQKLPSLPSLFLS